MVALRALVCSRRWGEGWAAIRVYWQQERAARQAGRARGPIALPAIPAPPERPPPTPMVVSHTRPRRRLVVNGRPTADHPWRRRFLPPRPRPASSAIA